MTKHDMRDRPFIWRGKEIKTMGDTLNVVERIVKRNSRAEAMRFMKAYRAVCDKPETADDNIGYGSGYFDYATAARIRKLFNVVHPIFGSRTPTPKEAFEAGVKTGKAMMKEEK